MTAGKLQILWYHECRYDEKYYMKIKIQNFKFTDRMYVVHNWQKPPQDHLFHRVELVQLTKVSLQYRQVLDQFLPVDHHQFRNVQLPVPVLLDVMAVSAASHPNRQSSQLKRLQHYQTLDDAILKLHNRHNRVFRQHLDSHRNVKQLDRVSLKRLMIL